MFKPSGFRNLATPAPSLGGFGVAKLFGIPSRAGGGGKDNGGGAEPAGATGPPSGSCPRAVFPS